MAHCRHRERPVFSEDACDVLRADVINQADRAKSVIDEDIEWGMDDVCTYTMGDLTAIGSRPVLQLGHVSDRF